MADLIQFKRASSATWESLNYILAIGEPGYEKNTNRMKIGDGVTPWNLLPYVGEHSVFNALTPAGFPSIGEENVIYKSEQTKSIYQWNQTTLNYEKIGEEDSTDYDLIHGGNASGE